MAENGYQFRWNDDEEKLVEQDLEKIPRPLWHNLLDLGLIVLTVAAEITVGRIWPQLVCFNVVSYFLIGYMVLGGIYLLLDRFFPEWLRAYVIIFIIIAFLVPRGRPGRMMRSRRHLKVMPPPVFTGTLFAYCISSIPVAFFNSINKFWFFTGILLISLTVAVILVIRITGRQRHDRRAQEKQELLEQQKREELGRWK